MNNKKITIFLSLFIIVLLNTTCGIVKNITRDYSSKEFTSTDWKKGDAVERGRMLIDIYKKRSRYINGKNEKELLEIFGEPDTKKDKNDTSFWLYNLEFKGNPETQALGITIINGVGMYGVENQGGKMTVSD
jgi:hypothetical protein